METVGHREADQSYWTDVRRIILKFLPLYNSSSVLFKVTPVTGIITFTLQVALKPPSFVVQVIKTQDLMVHFLE